MKKCSSPGFMLLAAFLPIAFLAGCKKTGQPDTQVAREWKLGDVYFDKEKWTECVVGNMPLVISVPHGGQLTPDSIPNRNCPDMVTVTDSYTIEQAREIKNALATLYDVHPYLVICHLKRTKIDQNRAMAESACGNKAMEAPWKKFHNYIDTALAAAVKQFGAALYIDLHGHGHEIQRLEIGYALSANELNNVFHDSPGMEAYWRKSSLNNMKKIRSGSDFRKYIIGDIAFGSLMAAEGFRSVPSAADPAPRSGEPYFNGGFNSRRYTSALYPNVFGWQIESHYTGVRDAAGRPLFAKAFAKVIMDYLQQAIDYKP